MVDPELGPAEEAHLTAHLREGCPRCIGELAAARTISGLVALTNAAGLLIYLSAERRRRR